MFFRGSLEVDLHRKNIFRTNLWSNWYKKEPSTIFRCHSSSFFTFSISAALIFMEQGLGTVRPIRPIRSIRLSRLPVRPLSPPVRPSHPSVPPSVLSSIIFSGNFIPLSLLGSHRLTLWWPGNNLVRDPSASSFFKDTEATSAPAEVTHQWTISANVARKMRANVGKGIIFTRSF